ncbi:MAG: hypothetical protein HOV67_37080 [Kribbellaceae bacterium]|nr:hypothetical protein [Kribbellaceae bacterium]
MPELSVRRTFGHGAASLELVRTQIGLPRPVGGYTLADAYDDDKVFDEPLVTGDGVALGGHHRLVIKRDGSYTYSGYFRATGWPSYNVSLVTTLGYPVVTTAGDPPGAAQAVFTASGRVHGTNEPGDREYSWNKSGQVQILATEWQNVRIGTASRNLQYDADWFGSIDDVVSFIVQVVALGTVFGEAGVAIVCATEAAEILDMEELVVPGLVGIMIAGAAAYVFGPSMLIPAFLAGAVVTAALIDQRKMTDAEIAWARKIFGDELPVDRILLTNLTGFGGRPFTVEVPGGTILVNLGKGCDDPVNYTGVGKDGTEGWYKPGQLFAHELTHAWQINHASFVPEYYCRAIATVAFGGPSAYGYGPATESWGDFGTEGQANLVEEWYAGAGQQKDYGAMSEDTPGTPALNPYFRYVRDNIRAGIS